MTSGTTTYGDIGQRTAAWAATQMLKQAEAVVVLGKFGLPKPLPKNKADTVKFRRPNYYGAVSSPLTEGVTPTAQKFGYTDVTAVLKQWGGLFEITDVVNDLSEDPVLADASKACGNQSAATVEAVTYGVLKAGTNVFYSNGVVRTSVNSVITLSKCRAIVRALKAQKAGMITSVVDGGPKFASRAVEAGYVACAHTDLEADIRALPGFLPCAQYGSKSMVSPFEIGTVESIRFVLSPDLGAFADGGGLAATNSTVSTTGTQSDVYPVLVFGAEAFGLVPLKGAEAMTPKVLNPGKPDKSDPLGQRGYVGWIGYFIAVILNQLWMARLEVAVSSL